MFSAGGQFVVQAGVLKHDAEAFARFVLLRDRVETVELDVAAGGLEQRRQHLDRGGFAGAVRPQEGEDLASLHVEGDAR